MSKGGSITNLVCVSCLTAAIFVDFSIFFFSNHTYCILKLCNKYLIQWPNEYGLLWLVKNIFSKIYQKEDVLQTLCALAVLHRPFLYLLLCMAKPCFAPNRAWQISQENGLSPVCVLRCFSRVSFRGNPCEQTKQKNGRSPPWTCICWSSTDLWKNDLWQISQEKLRIPVWMTLCPSSPRLETYDLSHWSHCHGFSFGVFCLAGILLEFPV